MFGRLFGIKKSILLHVCAFMLFCDFLVITIPLTFVLGQTLSWFFAFCLCFGAYLSTKGVLFRLDSAFFVGIALLLCGAVGLLNLFGLLGEFASVFYVLSFALSSLLVGLFFRQKFQRLLGFCLLFVALSLFFTKIKIIPPAIFLAICIAIVLLFIWTNLKSINRKGG